MNNNQEPKRTVSMEEAISEKMKGNASAREMIEDSPLLEDFIVWCANRGLEPDDDAAQLFIDMSEAKAMEPLAAADLYG